MERTGTYNAATDLIGRNLVAGRGGKTAFIDPARSLSYDELEVQTNRFANMLYGMGLRREDRIALILQDTVDFPIAFLGAIKAGVIPIPLNTLLSSDQFTYILGDSRVRAAFVSTGLMEVVAPALEGQPLLERVILSGDAIEGHLSLQAELAGKPTSFVPAATVADEVAFWLYSSGSTGMPKGVRHVHSSLMDTAENFGQAILDIQTDDVVFSAAKLFFAYGLGNGLSFPMSVGATAVLLPGRPTPQVVFDILETHKPQLFFGVPTLYAAMLSHAEAGGQDCGGRLRLCVSAGEALPEEVGQSWKTRFGVDIVDGVGSTEMLHVFLSNRPGDIVYGTSGTAVPGYDLRLVDEHGQEAAAGEIGELLVRGSSACDGYWNQRAKTRNTFQGEWTRTGDKYVCDENGRFTYCGRTDDMFKVSGIWVSPFEVESALISHDSVLEAAVVPAEDPEGLIKPKAFVVLNNGISRDGIFETLKTHVKSEVGAWKYPRWIEFVDDLPKTATGKIQRYKLH